jgi:hypothetical protein
MPVLVWFVGWLVTVFVVVTGASVLRYDVVTEDLVFLVIVSIFWPMAIPAAMLFALIWAYNKRLQRWRYKDEVPGNDC